MRVICLNPPTPPPPLFFLLQRLAGIKKPPQNEFPFYLKFIKTVLSHAILLYSIQSCGAIASVRIVALCLEPQGGTGLFLAALSFLTLSLWWDHRGSPMPGFKIFHRNLWLVWSCPVLGYSCLAVARGRWAMQELVAQATLGSWLLLKPWPDLESWRSRSDSCGIASSPHIQMHLSAVCQPCLTCVALLHLSLCSLLVFSSFWSCIGQVVPPPPPNTYENNVSIVHSYNCA